MQYPHTTQQTQTESSVVRNYIPQIVISLEICFILFISTAFTSLIICCTLFRRVWAQKKLKDKQKKESTNNTKDTNSETSDKKMLPGDEDAAMDYLAILCYVTDFFFKFFLLVPYMFWIEDNVMASLNIISEPWKEFINTIDNRWDKSKPAFKSLENIVLFQCSAGIILTVIVLLLLLVHASRHSTLRYLFQNLSSTIQLFTCYVVGSGFTLDATLWKEKPFNFIFSFSILATFTGAALILNAHSFYCLTWIFSGGNKKTNTKDIQKTKTGSKQKDEDRDSQATADSNIQKSKKTKHADHLRARNRHKQ